ncbi:MAG: flagellin, partial [Oscillospiraceae bacterium]
TKHLSNSERLQKAVIEFTQKNGQALLNSKGGSDISGSVKLENGRLSIGFSPDDNNVYGLRGTDIKTADNARAAMADIKKASNAISKKRADTGTLYNMYDRTRQRLMNMETNLTASFSRLTDADIAKEMMTFVKEQVLSQASMFVMAQGRHQVEDILALLKT